MKYVAMWGIVGCALLTAACKKDHGSPFLPFDKLCPQRAEAVCSARASCCDAGTDTSTCVGDELSRCNEDRARFEDESALVYDSEQAARVSDEDTASLDACEGLLPLGNYFDGALEEGEACERNAECQSDSCGADSGVCEAPEMGEFCSAPE